MFPASLLPVLLLALAVAGNPVVIRDSPITMPLVPHLNFAGGFQSLIRSEVERAQALRRLAAGESSGDLEARGIVNKPVVNTGVSYTASIGVGSPRTTYNLLIDTGSSNTWVGANKAYVQTSESVKTSDSVSVTYGSGSFSGVEYTDTVTITPRLVIKGQSIGAALNSTGFESGVDGILGIGPVNLTQGTLSPDINATIPTVTDNAFSQGIIPAKQIGIFFHPTFLTPVTNGELTWGGVDKSKHTGPINYTPLTTTSPASKFWGINQSIRYGGSTNILSSTAGIVDTGSTLLLLATDAYDRYRAATGAVLDSNTGLLRITPAQYKNLKSLFFTTNGVTYEFVPNAQLWPRSLNLDIGGKVGDIYLIVADLGTPSGEGLDFINGYTFLERFYTVFDTGNQRVGFAKTRFTNKNIN